MKYDTKTLFQHNSPKTAQQNFVELYGYDEHTVKMCTFAGNFDLIFFLGIMLFLKLEI